MNRIPPFLVLAVCLVHAGCDSGPDELTGREDRAPAPDSIVGRVVDLATGPHHACAATAEGRLYCWGRGTFGQLGDGRLRSLAGPARVRPKTSFASVTAAGLSTCALDPVGQAWCWGWNESELLGHAEADTFVVGGPAIFVASEPFRVDTPVRFAQIESAGDSPGVCGLDGTGSAWCWGLLPSGADGSPRGATRPVRVADGHVFRDLAVAERHVCGVDFEGRVWCWGANETGQLGLPPEDLPTCGTDGAPCAEEPIAVDVEAHFVTVTTGFSYTCALASEGTAWCWGRADRGQTGAGETVAITAPAPIVAPVRFASVSAGGGHACGVTEAGVAWCWGSGTRGALGVDPDPLPSCGSISANKCTPDPLPVDTGFLFDRVAPGNNFTCGLTSGGRVVCWGNNFQGKLGNGTFEGWEATPLPVIGQR